MAGYAGTSNETFQSGRLGTLAGAQQRPSYEEDVLDQTYYQQGIETPIIETTESESTKSLIFECLMDDIEEDKSAHIAGEVQFGDWTTGLTTTPGRVRARNTTQIHTVKAAVADSEITQAERGVPGNEYDQVVWKRSQTLGLNMEQIALFNSFVEGANAAGTIGAGTASETHGLIAWALTTRTVATNTVAGVQIPVPFNSTVFAGAGTPLSKVELRDNIMQPYWSKGGQWTNTLCFVGPAVMNAISAFSHVFSGSGPTLSASPRNYQTVPASMNTIFDDVEILHTPWGVLFATKHRKFDNTATITIDGVAFVPNKCLFAYDPRAVRLRYKRRPTVYHLPKLGDGAAGRIKVEFGVEVRNPRALVFAHNIA